jgi:hypothetical protein
MMGECGWRVRLERKCGWRGHSRLATEGGADSAKASTCALRASADTSSAKSGVPSGCEIRCLRRE